MKSWQSFLSKFHQIKALGNLCIRSAQIARRFEQHHFTVDLLINNFEQNTLRQHIVTISCWRCFVMAGNNGRGRSRKLGGYIFLFLTVFILGFIFYYWQTIVAPAIDSIAEIKARALVTQIVNESINEQFSEESDATELLIIKTNNEGKVEMVQSNTKAINALITELSKEIQRRYIAIERFNLEVPLGTILGSRLLSQTGPNIDMKILPLSVSAMDFRTEFETEGINQTKYKVYVILESRAKVLAPFSTKTLELQTTILIAEAVILGDVPSSYVIVPQDNMIDGLQME